jgi:hypothetical protein
MKSYLSALAIFALLLTGCSTPSPESKPEYDEVELMVYQQCIEKIVDGYLNKGFFLMVPTYIENAEQECNGLKPLKK